ncbi:MAG: methyltransferase [Bacteroidales bacterium]|nr:methyltransferase [Bacteroidales bacterium]
MESRKRIQQALRHKTPDKVPVDFGSTTVTGIHIWLVEKLRNYYGLEKRPVKLTEPYQMLGEIDAELQHLMGVDVIGLSPRNNMFGFANTGWKEFKTFWGQVILVPVLFNTGLDVNGDLVIYPEGDTKAPPSAKMPKAGYFFDAIIRQEPLDESSLNPMDNLEEFKPVSEEDLIYWKEQIKTIQGSDKAVVANFGGTGIGDIALVPATFLKHPKGIRDVTEWYISTVMRPDYIKAVFDRQSDIAVENLKKLALIAGNDIDVLYVCGTDFGTQDSTFCSPETFDDLWMPYYQKINDWVHCNTGWKTFKHSCGAVESLISHFIDAGFDILNPVQINAKGMDSRLLKEKYGDHIVFWGGGVDTQHVLSFGTVEDVRKQVLQQCEVFSMNGGYVFNTVHNIQANVPVENVISMINALEEFNR